MEILGIDVGGSGIKGAPVDINTGALVTKRHRISTPQPATPEAVGEVIAEIVRSFEWDGPVGCAFPARIKQGVARTAANIDKAWIGTSVAQLIEDQAGCPAVVLNDADAAGVAEMRFGAGQNRSGLVLLLTFGTGIGSSLFINGTLVPNTEFGHITLHGMVAEHYAADRARKKNDLSWEAWAARAQEYLERIEFLLAPDLIILGGGVSKPKKREKYFQLLKTEAELVPAQLQNEAGIVGAAYSARILADVAAG